MTTWTINPATGLYHAYDEYIAPAGARRLSQAESETMRWHRDVGADVTKRCARCRATGCANGITYRDGSYDCCECHGRGDYCLDHA